MEAPESTQSIILRFSDLERQIWREINSSCDTKILKEKLKRNAKSVNEKLSDDFASQKVRDIQYCVKQSHDYFYSSKQASLVTKPTLIYYGLISLTSALIILKNRDKSLNSLREAHGLKDKYPENLKNTSPASLNRNNFLDISAEIQSSGTFVEAGNLNLSENFVLPIKHQNKSDTSKDYRQVLKWNNDNDAIKDIKLLTLLQNIPEVCREVKKILKKECYLYEGEAIVSDENVILRVLKGLNGESQIQQAFNFLNLSKVGESNNYFFFSTPREVFTNNTPLTKRDINGIQYLCSKEGNNIIAHDLILYYLTFFILGSISRYKPALWREILENPMHGLSTIPEILCESSYVKLPHCFLNELDNIFYKF